MDYTIYFKEELTVGESWRDRFSANVLISAFNSSGRVTDVFDKLNVTKKVWLILPEYEYDLSEIPESGERYLCEGATESDQLNGFFAEQQFDWSETKLVIDTTGFMRPHLAYFLRYLKQEGVREVEFIYSEPLRYSEKEATLFSKGVITEIRQVDGYGGVHVPDTSNDVLIIGAGYDHVLINSVAEHKEHAEKIQLLGFPSLSPDMYQENVLKCVRTVNSIGEHSLVNPYFAPANDPFVTATELSSIVNGLRRRREITNLYLAPLSTKAQCLGFFLFYLEELLETSASVIYPFHDKYERETSVGLQRAWKYTIEF